MREKLCRTGEFPRFVAPLAPVVLPGPVRVLFGPRGGAAVNPAFWLALAAVWALPGFGLVRALADVRSLAMRLRSADLATRVGALAELALDQPDLYPVIGPSIREARAAMGWPP